MTATTVAGVGTRIGATVNGVAAAVARSLRVEREGPITSAGGAPGLPRPARRRPADRRGAAHRARPAR